MGGSGEEDVHYLRDMEEMLQIVRYQAPERLCRDASSSSSTAVRKPLSASPRACGVFRRRAAGTLNDEQPQPQRAQRNATSHLRASGTIADVIRSPNNIEFGELH
jgi:hypothetical protein